MRPRILEPFEALQAWERYMGGESVEVLGREYGLTADAVRKRLREQAERLGYGKGMSLREVRRARGGKGKRELSRERKRMLDWERSSHGVCYFCRLSLADHARCESCGVLLHGGNGAYTCGCGLQHGLCEGGGICSACKDNGGGGVAGVDTVFSGRGSS